MNFERLKFWKKQNIIEFYCHPALKGVIPEPTPAIKNLPKWYKNLSSECIKTENGIIRDNFGAPAMSAKMCLPMLDAMNLGFTIPLCSDLRIKSNHDNSQIMVLHNQNIKYKPYDFHTKEQVGGKGIIKQKQGDILKFNNPWIIKTAPGWSTLFIPPLNNFDNPFTAFAGVVDTDVFYSPVNFPVMWNLPNADITIKSKTPIVTVIPFKRNSITKKLIIKKFDDDIFAKVNMTEKIMEFRSQYYTHELRKRNEND